MESRRDASRRGITSKEMRDKRDDREQQQQMYQSAGYVEHQEATQPRKQQNYKQDDEHVSLLIFFN
jgi:hypothetical protein